MSEADTRRWSASRIASAAVLLVLVLAAIAYGIYSWVASGSSSSKTTATNQQLTAPVPNSKSGSSTTNNKTTNSKNTTKSTSNGAVSSSVGSNGTNAAKSASGSSSTAGTTSLSNTGPGDTAAIGFIAASVLGTAFHYGWRRRNIERS